MNMYFRMFSKHCDQLLVILINNKIHSKWKFKNFILKFILINTGFVSNKERTNYTQEINKGSTSSTGIIEQRSQDNMKFQMENLQKENGL